MPQLMYHHAQINWKSIAELFDLVSLNVKRTWEVLQSSGTSANRSQVLPFIPVCRLFQTHTGIPKCFRCLLEELVWLYNVCYYNFSKRIFCTRQSYSNVKYYKPTHNPQTEKINELCWGCRSSNSVRGQHEGWERGQVIKKQKIWVEVLDVLSICSFRRHLHRQVQTAARTHLETSPTHLAMKSSRTLSCALTTITP